MFVLRKIGPVTAQTEIEVLAEIDVSGDFELRLIDPSGAFYASSEAGQADPDLQGLLVASLPASPLRLSDGDELYVFNNEPSTARTITVLAYTV
jgi:hypothetical protein